METSGPFNLLHDLSASDQFIRGDNFLRLSKELQNVVYCKRDFIFKSGDWRGVRVPSLISNYSTLQSKVLVLGHSDIKTRKVLSRILKSTLGLKVVFGTNSEPSDGIVQSLPLGLTNVTSETPLHGVLGNDEHFYLADSESEFASAFHPELYANFTLGTNAPSRKGLLRALSNLPTSIKVFHSHPEFSQDGRVNYLRKCRTSNFVLCPEGNGIDTHRLWETLYMGGTPVVKKNMYMSSLFNRLPVVQVEDWEDLRRPDFLEREWDRARAKTWDKSLLLQSTWSGLIRTYATD